MTCLEMAICLFNSIAYEMQHCSLSSDTIRSMLVSHLRENAMHYSSFVSSTVPASGNNAYNADTEAPDEVDTCIALMSDCEEQSQFRWERYLHGLSNGAWGDHIALQGISNIFKISIQILQINDTDREIITNVCPSDGVSNYNVNLGLLLQFHYAGLDLVDSSFEDENVNSSLCTNTD